MFFLICNLSSWFPGKRTSPTNHILLKTFLTMFLSIAFGYYLIWSKLYAWIASYHLYDTFTICMFIFVFAGNHFCDKQLEINGFITFFIVSFQKEGSIQRNSLYHSPSLREWTRSQNPKEEVGILPVTWWTC